MKKHKSDQGLSRVSLERLKEKISAVDTNMAIYKDQLKRVKRELKKDYDLDVSSANDRLIEIDKETRALNRKEKRLLRIATRILDEMEDE